LKEVRHVPDLRKNLISTGKLASEGCISIFTDNMWNFIKGSLVIVKGEKVGTLYLCTSNTDSSISLASTGVDTTLWHHSLGKMSEKGMQIVYKRNLLPDLKQIDLDFFEHCVYGKQKRVIFLRVGKEKKSERLELVHTNVWGPTQVSSLSGSHYYITFIDDATRKTWVCCIRQKSDVFDTFKKWKALVENETRKNLKCLRSDNGGEYCSKDFDDYFSYHGIHREKTVPRTPQENGVSERMNRTTMEFARSMRLHFGFPLQFCADVVDTFVYLINKGPSSSLDGRIPEEEWTGKMVNYSFLKTCQMVTLHTCQIDINKRLAPHFLDTLHLLIIL
jgi:transposase InsO family protein